MQLYSAVKWKESKQVRLRELHLPGDEGHKLVSVDINSHYAGAVGPLQLGELWREVSSGSQGLHAAEMEGLYSAHEVRKDEFPNIHAEIECVVNNDMF